MADNPHDMQETRQQEIQIVPMGEQDYSQLLLQAVAVLDETRTHVARQVNSGLCSAYYHIGRLLHERKLDSHYGGMVVKRLSADLKNHYPQMGFSPRNMWDMKRFYLRYYQSDIKLRQVVAVLPWSHNLLLLNKDLDDNQTAFYAQQIVTKGWSRELLLNALKLRMHEQQGAVSPTSNNFADTLPAVQAQYANEVFHSTYNLGFLGIMQPVLETQLEQRLVEKIKLFLLELGKGFTYIGNQYPLESNGKEYRVDMLFFHRGLRCLVAIDLKIGEFKPEYAGKMNYYLSLLDRTERQEGENRSIGIILCAEKDDVDVQLALEDMGKPIGVADYQLMLPTDELRKVITDEIQRFDAEYKG